MLPRYRIIADLLRQTLESGTLRPGDRMISARRLAEREGVSLPTAVEALRCLEADGWIVARPRSGYFLRGMPMREPAPAQPSPVPLPVTMSALARSLFSSSNVALTPLGAALPDPTWLPSASLQRSLHAAGRRLGAHSQTYSVPPGRIDLRRQIALRAAEWGARFGADDLVTTAGATQALRLALQAVCKPGDIVAVESPAYFGTLLLLESLGLKALEIPTGPGDGIDLSALSVAIEQHRPAAVVASPTVQNPLGACMSIEAKRGLVALLARTATPLIEDDVYGDLAGDDRRPPACKAFDETGNVLYCSSVSKTLAPGWRVGWIAAGRFHDKVLQTRLAEDWAGVPLIEGALADFLAGGDYDRHLRKLKPRVLGGLRAVTARVEDMFPAGTLISRPKAGFLLWIELPPSIDALDVYHKAQAERIGVSPGHLFSAQSSLTHHLRLNCANEPTPRLLRAVDRLGEICRGLETTP
jgi:DNA-binding transcriptional MocR family regulator